MRNKHSSTTGRPDAWLSSVMSGRVSQATDRALTPETIYALIDRLRLRLQEERALTADLRAQLAQRDGTS